MAEDDWLTTTEAAKLLHASRQHVVNLCEAGDLPFSRAGSHRRLRRADVEAHSARSQRLSREDMRSLWLGRAVAGKLVLDPEAVLAAAQVNLAKLQARHMRGQAARWLAEWDRLLSGPVEDVLEALTSITPHARELRQNNPFAGVLTEAERQKILDNARLARGPGRPIDLEAPRPDSEAREPA
jgi:excisionase family DNA binding protein